MDVGSYWSGLHCLIHLVLLNMPTEDDGSSFRKIYVIYKPVMLAHILVTSLYQQGSPRMQRTKKKWSGSQRMRGLAFIWPYVSFPQGVLWGVAREVAEEEGK